MQKKSFISNFISLIEKGGNKLPHPFILFANLIIITLLASFILNKLGVEVVYLSAAKQVGETNKEITIKVVNLLSKENLRYLFINFPDIFVSYAPLKLILILMVATVFIEKTGFFETLMKKYLLKAPKSIITFTVLFMAINSNLMSNAGTIFAVSMGGIIFSALGRNPLIGIIIGYVGSSGGFTANIFLAGTDALLAGITENCTQNMGLNISINPTINYFFMATSTFFLALTTTIFTEKVVVKMLGDGDGKTNLELLNSYQLTPEQEKGLKYAFYGFIIFCMIMLFLTLPKNAFFRNTQGNFLPKSPLFQGIISIVTFLFLITGIPYGVATGSIKEGKDIPRFINYGFTQAIPFLTTTLMAAVFIELLNKSNIFKIIAIRGAEILKSTHIGVIPMCLTVILITTIINPFMTSGSSKWLLIGPMIVPVFTLLNVHPAYAQLAYRIGDSCTNIISPLDSSLPVIIGLIAEYQDQGKIPIRPGEKKHREIGLGTIFALTIPYSIVLLVTMTIMFIFWLIFKLPIGPGVPLHLI